MVTGVGRGGGGGEDDDEVAMGRRMECRRSGVGEEIWQPEGGCFVKAPGEPILKKVMVCQMNISQ